MSAEGRWWYADASAFAKLVTEEAESAALRAWLAAGGVRLASCDLLRTEALRAARRRGGPAVDRAGAQLERVALVALDRSLYEAAGRIDPPEVRSLDAVHLAAALALGADLAGVLTYDARMASAAEGLGLEVAAPTGRG